MNRSIISLTQEEIQQYRRHLSLQEIGQEGQLKLKTAKVLCVGAGGLGSPLLLYLAAAGVGTLGIVDNDVVDISNLQRQVLYSHQQINEKKTIAAKAQLENLNPYINVVSHDIHLNPDNVLDILQHYDIIADCSDNFATRYLINDACFQLGKPNVYASIYQFEGQCSIFTAKDGPCYRCLYPLPPAANVIPDCVEAGVLGVLPGVMGTIQATEVIKLILNLGQPLIGKLLLYDALSMQFSFFEIYKNSECDLCAHKKSFDQFIHNEIKNCQIEKKLSAEISVQELYQMQQKQENFFLLDVRERYEYEIGHLGGYLIPLNELDFRVHELDPNKKIIIYCKSGVRSKYAQKLLREKGFKSVWNLTGGIMAWARHIDASLAY